MKWSLADWWFILRSAHLLGLVVDFVLCSSAGISCCFFGLFISWVSMTVGVFLFFFENGKCFIASQKCCKHVTDGFCYLSRYFVAQA